MAVKQYLNLKLEDLLTEQKALNLYFSQYSSYESKAENFLTTPSECRRLASPYFHSVSQELSDWANAPYERNKKFPEKLIHKTSSGIMVRSKSESLIAFLLHTNKIPFRYEALLTLDKTNFYPDFTIRHPRTGATYYWDHFGMMDDPAYSQNVFSKLQLYNSHGIIPSIQLITTYETKNYPLDTETVEKIITHYFL